jgi:xylose isomerase
MSKDFFAIDNPIAYEGPDSTNPLAFRWYDKDRVVLGKTLEQHLRFAVCYWHSFCWPGSDVFGEGTFDRPWLTEDADSIESARQKLDVAFEFFSKLGVPYFCFHDRDIAPEGKTAAESRRNLELLTDLAGEKMAATGVKLLWGTANLFSHRRYAAGAATNPDPLVFSYATHQIKSAIDVTHKLKGENYVLWGGREGYETLLNTDLKQEAEQFGRFLAMVAEYKHQIGFKGTLLIEPKPQEPTKHQYDYDTAAVYGFLKRFGLEQEYKVNIEVNHATLAGHSFQHELAVAASLGILGSVDANRGDYQNDWDTDQFPNSVDEMALACYEIIRSGGLTTGGFNFDTKLRRQSTDRMDLFYGHIGGMDVLAQAFLAAAELYRSNSLQEFVDSRYQGWQAGIGSEILSGKHSLASLAEQVESNEWSPQPVSGQQEKLEILVNQSIDAARNAN